MRAVCAWCGKDMGPRADEDIAGPITHGICSDCELLFTAEPGRTLREFLERLPEPVLVMDGDGAVRAANTSASRVIGKGLEAIEGYLGGDVLECAYAHLPGGCGKTVHCVACTIRGTVSETHRTGLPQSRVRTYLDTETAAGIQRRVLYVSTEKRGGCVVLRLDDEPADGTDTRA